MGPSPHFTGFSVTLCPFLVLLEELMTQFRISEGFGLVGYLYFGAVTFSQIFCNSVKALLKTALGSLPLTKKLLTDSPCTAQFVVAVPVELFRLAVSLWQCSALQSDMVVLKARYEERIRGLEKDQDGSSPADFTEEVSICSISPY